MSNYPPTLEDALGRPLKFPAETLKAVRSFAASKPWRGTFEERQAKFKQLHTDLCRIYAVNPTLNFQGDGTGDSGGSSFQPGADVITLTGRLSGAGGEQDGTGVEAVAHEKSQPVSTLFPPETKNARKNRIGTPKMGQKWPKSQSLTVLRLRPAPAPASNPSLTKFPVRRNTNGNP